MSFAYKKILVIGATSGIGHALAARFVQEGSKVIVVGRRQERLDEFVRQHGRENASAVAFDISRIDKIPDFAVNITNTHPDLDCVLLNSGIQRRFDFSKPETVDMSTVQDEFHVNYISFLALTKAFVPFLQRRTDESALIYTTSGLAMVPLPTVPNYCASKAALHSFILCLREQLKGSKIKVIELFPPLVQTELHDERHQPGVKNGRSWGMPIDEFTEEAYQGLAAGKDQVPVGTSKRSFDGFEVQRQQAFHALIKAMSGTLDS